MRSTTRCGLLSLCCVATALLSGRAHAEPNELETAYKREFAFLEAEKSTLSSRLAEAKKEHETKVAAAKSEIDHLQGRATSLSLEADRLTEQLSEVEEKSAAEAEAADVLQTTLQQAELQLAKGGFKLPTFEKEPTPEQRLSQLDFAFDKGVALLNRYASVRAQAGDFFDQRGKKVSGTIVHVGQVAAYGVSPSASGALAPAGEERFKLWPDGNSAATASALKNGRAPDSLKIFLFESLEKEVAKAKEKTLDDVMKAGGPIGYAIVVLGLLAAVMIVVRGLLLLRAAANTDSLVKKIAPLLKRHELQAALAQVRAAKSSAARVLEATLRAIQKPREQLEDVISEAVLREQPALDRFSSTILVAAAVAPLLGLLGTVTGMISTFDVITEYGNGNPKLLAGGISEALVTTELGLIVAIPALLLGNLLNGWAQSIKDDIDGAALRVTNIATGNDIDDLAEPATPPPAPAQLAPAE